MESKHTKFVVPSLKERINAIGPLTGANKCLTLALQDIDQFWKPIPKPKSGYWLREHHEDGQTHEQFMKGNRNIVGKEGRKAIYIQPLQEMSPVLISSLFKYCGAFFCTLPIKLLPVCDIAKMDIEHRMNNHKLQYHASKILNYYKSKMPKDAYCLICILHDDLYPEESWNFVYGLAYTVSRVGVFSFARYNPNFYEYNEVEDINEYHTIQSSESDVP